MKNRIATFKTLHAQLLEKGGINTGDFRFDCGFMACAIWVEILANAKTKEEYNEILKWHL